MRSRFVQRTLFVAGLIALWQLSYFLGVDVFAVWKSYAVPSPAGVLKSFLLLSSGSGLGIAMITSMRRILIGFSVSAVLGSLLGLLMTRFKYLSRNLKPLILGLQTLPSICWVPFAILWYGLSENAIVFIIIIGSTFAIALAAESGIRNVEPLYIRAARTMGARESDLWIKVILPAAMPSLVAGMKQGWSFSWRSLMAGEMMFSSIGLGQILMMGRDLADINQVMVIMIIIVFIGTVIDRFIFSSWESGIRKRRGLDRDHA